MAWAKVLLGHGTQLSYSSGNCKLQAAQYISAYFFDRFFCIPDLLIYNFRVSWHNMNEQFFNVQKQLLPKDPHQCFVLLCYCFRDTKAIWHVVDLLHLSPDVLFQNNRMKEIRGNPGSLVKWSLNSVCVCVWQDRMSNTAEVLLLCHISGIGTFLLQARFRWVGHLVRMEDNRIPIQIVYGLQCWPVRRYKDAVKVTRRSEVLILNHWVKLRMIECMCQFAITSLEESRVAITSLEESRLVSVCHHLTQRVTGCVSLPSPHSKSHGLPCWRGNGQPANIRPPTSLAWHGRATDKQSLHFQNLAVRSSMKQFIIHVCVSYLIKHQKHIFSKTSFNQPAKLPLACQRANNLLIFLSFIFFNPPLGDQLSQNMLNWSLPNFQIDTQMGEHDQSNLLFAIAQETLLW